MTLIDAVATVRKLADEQPSDYLGIRVALNTVCDAAERGIPLSDSEVVIAMSRACSKMAETVSAQGDQIIELSRKP